VTWLNFRTHNYGHHDPIYNSEYSEKRILPRSKCCDFWEPIPVIHQARITVVITKCLNWCQNLWMEISWISFCVWSWISIKTDLWNTIYIYIYIVWQRQNGESRISRGEYASHVGWKGGGGSFCTSFLPGKSIECPATICTFGSFSRCSTPLCSSHSRQLSITAMALSERSVTQPSYVTNSCCVFLIQKYPAILPYVIF
jgi:hypothetical protein